MNDATHTQPPRTRCRYSMLALDLDGTLLDPQGRVSRENADAVRRARDAGVSVVVCTGRGLEECRPALDAIGQTDPVAVAGGSIIACPQTRRTLHRFAINRDMVHTAVETLVANRHAALVLKDPLEAGYDYLVVHGADRHPLDPVTEWWFSVMDVKVRYAEHLHHDEHPEHTVRVGACGLSRVLDQMKGELHAVFGERVMIHSFPCVVAPHMTRQLPDGQMLHILELFDSKATKWSAISHMAAGKGIPHHRIAAIGDEVNDVDMIANAGLGVAMGNAVPAVRKVAAKHTAPNTDHGVARAIDHILSGAW